MLFLQEVLLKRAADLVEALYGMPHNNQVGRSTGRGRGGGRAPCGLSGRARTCSESDLRKPPTSRRVLREETTGQCREAGRRSPSTAVRWIRR